MVPCLAILFSGCIQFSTAPAPEARDLECSEKTGSTLLVGDSVTVSFGGPGAPEMVKQKISTEGTIDLPPPMNREVVAKGRTVTALENEIQQIVDEFFKQVAAFVSEQRYFTVQGDVRGPSQYPHPGRLTITQAIATAGDFTNYANRRKVMLTRASGRKIQVDCIKALQDPDYNPAVCPGDTVFVPRKIY